MNAMPRSSAVLFVLLFGGPLLPQLSASAWAEDGPAESIPIRQLINERLPVPPGVTSMRCSDAEFLRRVSLDLIGMPPLASEARAFLADKDPDKRQTLVDRLFSTPQHSRHLAAALDLMLMERRANSNVTQDEWLAWLVGCVRENKPWNAMVREILSADGDDPARRAPARFYLDRGSEPNVIARDLGRMFFGRDLQCAQCHDSPLVSDFLQSDYQGLLAFTTAGYELKKKHGDKDVNVYAERSGSDLPFESVFNKGTPHRSGARLPGMPTIDEPFYLPGDDYVVAPADAVRAVPKFSRRERLVELVTSGQNVAFNENIANRLWYLVMGRGLVHPLDMMHADNPAVDPELLRLLGQRFAADGFNIRGFIRELLLSDLYQRVFDLPRQTPQVAPVLAQQLPSLEQELSVRTDERRTKGTEYDAATTAFEAAEAALIPVAQELDAARNTYAEAAKKTSEARAASAAAAAAYQTKQQAVMALISSVESATAAAGILPEDAELAAVQARLSARLQQLQGEIPTLKTSSEEKLAAVAPLEAAQETARGTVEQVRLKSEPLKSALRHAEQAVVAARAAAQFAASQVAALEGRIQSTQLVVALGGLTESIAVAQAAVQKHEAEQSALATRVAQGTATVADLQSQLEQARQAEANAAAALASADASVSQAQSLQGKLTEAMVSLQNAQAAVQGDAAIQVLISTMDQRLTLLKSQTVTAQTIQMQRTTEKQAAGAAVMEITAAVDRMAAELKAAESAMLTTQQALQAVRDELSTRQQELLESESMVAQNWAERFQLANLKPLTPEQLCWSVFRVTTVYDRYLATEAAELEKASPLSDAQKQDPAALAARSIEIEQRTFDKLKGNLGTWIQFYGGGAGQPQGDFFASADQALFTSNGGAVNSWVVPAGDNAAERIVKATDAVTAAEELYLGILTRMPEPEEIEEVAAVLQARTDRSLAAQELVWGLLNSAEFRFNH